MIYRFEVQKTVNGEKVVEERILNLEEGMSFSGRPLKEQEDVKRFLGLPLTKPLSYYRKVNGEWAKTEVKEVRFAKLFPEWFILDVDGVRCHSDYFAHMQKSSFVRDMENEMKNSSS